VEKQINKKMRERMKKEKRRLMERSFLPSYSIFLTLFKDKAWEVDE
jgi:hypothetical protein